MFIAASSQLTGLGKASLPLRFSPRHSQLENTVFLLLAASHVQMYLGEWNHCQIASVLIDNCQIPFADFSCEQQLGNQ